MPIAAGTRLGSYEIIALLGVGGMGEVYRARDTRLQRDVAFKVLPARSIADTDRQARFEREALVLASLNHPHIAAIYGVEDVSTDVRGLVLELVEGPTLAEQLERGRLALKPALAIAAQLCDALDAAHERGIVHRDLKPANIKVTDAGRVKVLDFGLAKLVSKESAEDDVERMLSDSPTATGTRAGVLLGTAAYMSPEQARGLAVDKRTDVWAFGCVLYEMLAGRPAFRGETTADVLSAILHAEPDFLALPAATPPSIRRLLERCLDKDRKRRLRDIADAGFALADASPDSVQPVPPARRAASRGAIAGAVAAAAAIGALAAWILKPAAGPPAASSDSIARLAIAPAEQLSFSANPLFTACGGMSQCGQRMIALSPDGRRIAYSATSGARRQLFVRDIDRYESRAIPGTDGAIAVTFSPDGQTIAFISDRKLKKVTLVGGAPEMISDFIEGTGISWNAGAIYFTPGLSRGVWRVNASGGTPEPVTTLEGKEVLHRFGELLPTGNALLFTALTGVDDDQIYAQPLGGGPRQSLFKGTSPHYVSGYLTFVQASTLFAVPFDLARLEARGTPQPIVGDVGLIAGTPQVAFSDRGSLIYLPAATQSFESSLVWVDQQGTEQPTGASGRPFIQPRLAPDGRRVAVALRSGTLDLWSFDLGRENWTRLTYDAQASFPIWNPDGARLTYGSTKDGAAAIFEKPIGAPDAGETLVRKDGPSIPLSWSRDGRTLAYVWVDPLTGQDLWTYERGRAEPTQPFLQTRFREGAPTFSPDGRWIAYVSDESGRTEIYARPYPGPGDKLTISVNGGNEPVWTRSNQIFYRNGNAVLMADITTSPSFSVSKPRVLFEKSYEPSSGFWPNYDVTPDGRRLLMIQPSDTTPPPTAINVVLHWVEELARQ